MDCALASNTKNMETEKGYLMKNTSQVCESTHGPYFHVLLHSGGF